MHITAIICEYNPFHLGHSAQIAAIREKEPGTAVLALMSGSFVQRGMPAVFPKYDRARGAVLSGADLVLELPFPFCMAPAERFASAAVSLLDRMGGVGTLFFGSESGDLSELTRTAERMSSRAFTDALAAAREENRHSSLSHPRLAGEVYRSLWGDGFPRTPNDILAVEYLRALRSRGSSIRPVTHGRTGDYSASGARAAIGDHGGKPFRALVPPQTAILLRTVGAADAERLSAAVLAYYRLAELSALKRIPGTAPGEEYRFRRAACAASDLEGFLSLLRTKKETDAALRRMIWYGVLGVDGVLLSGEPEYTLLLAANETGCAALKELKKRTAVPILTRPSEGGRLTGTAAVQFDAGIRAERLYALARAAGKDTDPYRQTPYIFRGSGTETNDTESEELS